MARQDGCERKVCEAVVSEANWHQEGPTFDPRIGRRVCLIHVNV